MRTRERRGPGGEAGVGGAARKSDQQVEGAAEGNEWMARQLLIGDWIGQNGRLAHWPHSPSAVSVGSVPV